jgi:transaldolase
MALFIDSSDPKQIADLFRWGALTGVTTNPLILAREAQGADLRERMQQVLDVSTGDVSVELTTENEQEMMREALEYAEWHPTRMTIKVPMSEVGMRVLSALVKRNIKTNLTCLMSENQAYLGALAGATYVSIFMGRIADMGYDPRPTIEATRKLIDRERLESRLIIGSIRQMLDVNVALASGAHVVTVTPPILRKMAHHPRTVETIEEFNRAWGARADGDKIPESGR